VTRFHDTELRTTPVELLLPEIEYLSERLDRIRTEAREKGGVPADPVRFMGLENVARLLADVRAGGESSDSAIPYATLILHGLRWDDAGQVCLALTAAGSERALEEDWEEGAVAAPPPSDAGWLQLPRNLFWIDAGGQTPEPLEGFYWYRIDERLSLLLAAGVRPDRPGLSVFALDPLPWRDVAGLPSIAIRGKGEDFANTLPGGELSGLRSITTAGEAFKLAALVGGLLDRNPEWLSAQHRPERRDAATRSTFPYRIIDPPTAST
jgi:hypothetical protein